MIGGVADPTWAQGLGERRPGDRGTFYYRHEDRQKIYDAVIEVIDLRNGRLLTSRRYDRTLDLVIEPGLVGSVRETEDGVFLEVFQITLDRRL